MKKITFNKIQAEKILRPFSSYADFSKDREAAFKFTNLVGVKVCPYCNIEYTYTVYRDKNKPVLRPDIDHFLPKSSHLEQQLDVMNLIPACFACNQRLKRDKSFSRTTHIHPYYDDFDSIVYFSINLKELNYLNEDSFDLILKKRKTANTNDYNRAINNIKDFCLNERYEHHKDVVIDIFSKIRFYNNAHLNEISNITGYEAKLKDFLLSKPLETEINNTSLGKLKKDILDKYK